MVAVYLTVASAVLTDAGVDAHDVDEVLIVYVGGTTILTTLSLICFSVRFREEIETPLSRGAVEGGPGRHW